MAVIVGWVLFDNACGLCRLLADRGHHILGRRGFVLEPLQSPWVGKALGVAEADLLSDVRLWLADGRQYCGADVYRVLLKNIWWASPLYILSIIPGVRLLFDRTYRFVADHRHLMVRSCPP